MKTISLTQGKVTLVDDDVYEWASKFKWHALKSPRNFYAVRGARKIGKKNQVAIYLHREILPLAPGLEVDHIDGDGLNNLRENLRPATRAQNAHNRRHQKSTSKFKGVCRQSDGQKWRAQIRLNKKLLHLGSFILEEDAARAYDDAARKRYGEYVAPNFPKT